LLGYGGHREGKSSAGAADVGGSAPNGKKSKRKKNVVFCVVVCLGIVVPDDADLCMAKQQQ